MSMPRLEQPPVYAPATPPTAHDWNGCYGGLHGGGQIMNFHYDTISTPYGVRINQTSEHSATFTSALFGGQIGCNASIGYMLAGVEFDAWYAPGPFDETCKTLIDPILDCVRVRERPAISGAARFGFVHSSFLFYGKVGLAYLNTDFESVYHRSKPKGNTPTVGAPFQYEEKHTRNGLLSRTGLLLGFGLEYAIDENWSTKLEYNNIVTTRSEFNSTIEQGGFICNNNVSGSFPVACNTGANTDTSGMVARQVAKLGRSIVKVGLNRKF